MSAGHTPGPWAIERDGGHELTGVEAEIAEMQECEPYALATIRIVAPSKPTGSFRRNPATKAFDVPVPFDVAERVYDPRHSDPAEHEANARLIAAAPELLSACSDWIEWLNTDTPWREDAADYEAGILDAMRAAIAKARAPLVQP